MRPFLIGGLLAAFHECAFPGGIIQRFGRTLRRPLKPGAVIRQSALLFVQAFHILLVAVLQRAARFKLGEHQIVLLAAIPQQAIISVFLVFLAQAAVFSAQLVPESGQPGAEAFLPCLCFLDPAFLDPIEHHLAFDRLPFQESALVRFVPGLLRVYPLLQFALPARERGLHILGDVRLGVIERGQRIGFAQTGAYIFCFDTHPFGEGVDFPLMIDREIPPSVATGQRIAAFL